MPPGKRISTTFWQAILDPHRRALRDELRAQKPPVLQLLYGNALAAEAAS
jgi:hypothetical protein